MFFYTKEGQKINIYVNKDNKIGGQTHGNIYKFSEDTCIKVYKQTDEIDKEVLEFIKKLKLRNYYQIYDIFFDSKGKLKAHIMKYYKPEEIDILTTPMAYTINNLYNLLLSVDILNRNNILINDMHTGNMVLGERNITIIDTDLYTFNKFYTNEELKIKNLYSLKNLFEQIYLEALIEYHPELKSKKIIEIIKNLFKVQNKLSTDDTFILLEKYDYPIDYIKRRIKNK